MTSNPNLHSGHDHSPLHPSHLRQAFTPSSYGSTDDSSSTRSAPTFHSRAGPSTERPTEATALLESALNFREPPHEGPCYHGVFSPRPTSPNSSVQGDLSSLSDDEGLDGTLSPGQRKRKGWKKRVAAKIKSKKISSSRKLAQRYGVEDSAWM